MTTMTTGVTTAVCSLSSCGGAAVLQWLRRGTDGEASAQAMWVAEAGKRIADATRGRLIVDLAGLRSQHEVLVDQGAPLPVISQWEQQIAQLEADLEAVTDPVLPLTAPAVTVTVLACEVHQVSQDAAMGLHESHCLVDGPCECVL